MNNKSYRFELSRNTQIIIFTVSLFTLLFHLYSNLFANYGIFRDEFYYFACTNRLAAGYVDQPPLSIYLLALSKLMFGSSLFAIRLFPAFAAAVTVNLTGLLTARMGGGAFAVLTACVTLALSPIFLAMNTFFSMNAFDHLFWVLSAYLVVRIVQENKSFDWILLGISLGLGMLNKISMIWFGAGLTAGLLLTPYRTHLKTKWPYITALIAFLIFSPYIIWNILHDFAHLEFIRNATRYKYNTVTPADFIGGQLLLPGPTAILIWLPGLIYLLIGKAVKNFRILALIFLTTFIILIINWHSKPEYLAPAFPVIIAGGGLFIERVFSGRTYGSLKYAVIFLIIVSGIISAPLALPVLPVKKFISYSQFIGVGQQNSENKEMGDLPQFYADMFGWEELAKDVSDVYTALPDTEKAGTVVFADNYGEAGALEYYASRYSLPKVICPHNSYWFWSDPDNEEIKTVIVLGGNIEDHKSTCKNITLAGIHKVRYSMPYENNLPIYICRDIYRSLKEVWRQARFYI